MWLSLSDHDGPAPLAGPFARVQLLCGAVCLQVEAVLSCLVPYAKLSGTLVGTVAVSLIHVVVTSCDLIVIGCEGVASGSGRRDAEHSLLSGFELNVHDGREDSYLKLS